VLNSRNYCVTSCFKALDKRVASYCRATSVWLLLYSVLCAAHAKLMMRDEVTVQDAVCAVSVMESSMQVTRCHIIVISYMLNDF